MRALTPLLRAIGMLLYRLRLHRPVIWLRRRQPKVLAYHACAAVEGPFLGGLDSNTSPAAFNRHLDFLVRHYRIIPLAALHTGSVPEGGMVLTFDDGYRSVYSGAFPLLRARQLPATVYLIADAIDNATLVWVNALAWLLHSNDRTLRQGLGERLRLGTGLTAEQFVQAAQADRDPAEIERAIHDTAAEAGLDLSAAARTEALYLSLSEIAEMASAGISFGNHTRSHPNLTRLSAEAQRDEFVTAEQRLAALPGRIASAAYPFGAHDQASGSIARSAGAVSVMAIGGVNAPLDLGQVARIPVGEASVARLFADIEIVEPAKAWMRKWLSRGRPEAYA